MVTIVRKLALAGGFCVAAVAASAWVQRHSDAVISLNPDQTFQTMMGWEASTDLPDNPLAPPWAAYQAQLFETVVQEVGIDRLRLEVRSGAETSGDGPDRFLAGKMPYDTWRDERYKAENDNDDPFVINPDGFNFAELDWHVEHFVLPLRAALADEGRDLFINLCYVSFRDGQFFQMAPEEYAEFVLATYQHLDEKWGFVPDLWEVVLEPDLPKKGWTGAQMGAAMAATAKRLSDAGYAPAFAAPSVTNMAHALPYAQEILATPGAAEHWDELSYHRYRRASAKRVAKIADFAAENGLQPSMLEWWFGRADTDVLIEDLTVGMNASWQGRTLPGLVDSPDSPGSDLTLKEEVRFNSLYFKASPFGSIRIGVQSSAPRAYEPVAFQTPEGRSSVVVQANAVGNVTLTGITPGAYTLTRVGKTQKTTRSLTVGTDGEATVLMPFKGVFSITPVKLMHAAAKG